jgi:endoglucanase
MKVFNALFILTAALSTAACGGGGGSGSSTTTSGVSSAPAVSSSSVSLAESSSSLSIQSSSVSSSSSSSVSSVIAAQLYPSYNTKPVVADLTGMGSTAVQIAAKIKLGFNIGNTLEATGGKSETFWGNPKITPEFVKFVKQSGITAIRLPTSWDQYSDQTTAQIDPVWLNRVKEVVQYCVDNGLYVVVNIHWDGGWLENNVTPEKQVANNAKQKAFWEQIATQLRDFDEHVIFASANEPNVKYPNPATTQEAAQAAVQMQVLLSYHQTFIDAVRSTGGKNAYRTLIVQGPSTDIELTNKLMTKMPVDTVSNRMMAEVHYYTPWNYTGMTKDESWGNQFFYWGKGFHSTTDTAHNPTWGEEDFIDTWFKAMKTQFVDKGIPVIIGEFGTGVRTSLTGDALKLHLDGRAYYFKYIAKQALANGLLPFFWDTGGLLDRKNNVVLDQQAFDALIQGASGM